MKIHSSIALALIMVVFLSTVACTPVEQQAYRTIVTANAFLKSEYNAHPECKSSPPSNSNVCVILGQAVAAKDALIDAVEVYCAGGTFDNGGPCNAPHKGDSRYADTTQKLNAAIAAMTQIINDVKKAAGVADGSDPLPACRPPLKPPACQPPPPLA